MSTTTPRPHAVPARPLVRRSPVDVVVSDRWADVREAITMVHDGFVESGYMPPQPSGRRMILPYMTPGTAFYVARIDDAPAAVMALIPDGPFGLPADRAFREELDALRAQRRPLFECGSLVVLPAWRRRVRDLAAHLMGAASRLFLDEVQGGRVVIVVSPHQAGFYAGLLDFRVLGAERPLYGAPALLLETHEMRMREHLVGSDLVGQRLVADLVMADEAPWIDDRRGGPPWPAAELEPLLREQRVLDGLREQVRALRDLGLGGELDEDPVRPPVPLRVVGG